MDTQQFDQLLGKLSEDGRCKVLHYAVKQGLVDDEKYLVEIIGALIRDGILTTAEHIAREWGYKEASQKLMRAIINGCHRREAHGQAEDYCKEEISYPDVIRETPPSLVGIINQAEEYAEQSEKSFYHHVSTVHPVDNLMVPGPCIDDVVGYSKTKETIERQVPELVSQLRAYSQPHTAAKILHTLLFLDATLENLSEDTRYQWENLLIDCYLEAKDRGSTTNPEGETYDDYLLEAGDTAAVLAKSYKRLDEIEKAEHFSTRAYQAYEKIGAWKRAIKLAQELEDKGRASLYSSIAEFMNPEKS